MRHQYHCPQQDQPHVPSGVRRPMDSFRRPLILIVAAMFCVPGCAALRPLDGIPARYLPDTLKGPSRANRRTIDLSLLAQRQPTEYRIAGGDVLGIYIEKVLGRPDEVPPVHFAENHEVPPAMGYPIPVRRDGTISLPLLSGPVPVAGLTLWQIEQRIRNAYTVQQRLLNPSNARILVSLQQPRKYRVMVIRQEMGQGGLDGSMQFNLGQLKHGSGQVVTLSAYENDVMHALASTNGLPGLDAENTVYIIRRRPVSVPAAPSQYAPRGPQQPLQTIPQRANPIQQTAGWELNSPYNSSRALNQPAHSAYQPVSDIVSPMPSQPPPAARGQVATNQPVQPQWPVQGVPPQVNTMPAGPGGMWTPQPSMAWNGDWFGQGGTIDGSNVVKIPIRLAPGETPRFSEQDIILNDGDIVFIESRETEVFYTGGLLGGGQFTLPRDYDLDVLGAVSIAQGRGGGGGGGDGGAGGISALNQDVSISASKVIILRSMPNGSQMRIKVDLYKALRNPAERVVVQPGDYVILQYTKVEALGAWFERYILRSAVFGLAAGSIGGGGNN